MGTHAADLRISNCPYLTDLSYGGGNTDIRMDLSAIPNVEDLTVFDVLEPELDGFRSLKTLTLDFHQFLPVVPLNELAKNNPELETVTYSIPELVRTEYFMLEGLSKETVTGGDLECMDDTAISAPDDLLMLRLIWKSPATEKEYNIDFFSVQTAPGFLNYGGRFYRFFDGNEPGMPISGWMELDGFKFYFDEETRIMTTGWKEIDGVRCFFDENGHLLENAQWLDFQDVNVPDYFYDAVQWAMGKDIAQGLTENTFGPKEACSRDQVVTFLWRYAGQPQPQGENPFRDVFSNHFAHDPVLWAVETGVTNSIAPDLFGSKEEVTRAQFVTFLWRMAGKPEPKAAEKPFKDVTPDSWYGSAVVWAMENGITTGTSASYFGPEELCSRGQVVTLLSRYARLNAEP